MKGEEHFSHHPSPITHLSLWLPVLFWAALIFWLSSIPNLRVTAEWWDTVLRKIGHMVVFGILARLLARAWTGSTDWSWKKTFTASLISTALYACTDEYHQSFTPGRGPSVIDVGIDALGAWIALRLRS